MRLEIGTEHNTQVSTGVCYNILKVLALCPNNVWWNRQIQREGHQNETCQVHKRVQKRKTSLDIYILIRKLRIFAV